MFDVIFKRAKVKYVRGLLRKRYFPVVSRKNDLAHEGSLVGKEIGRK